MNNTAIFKSEFYRRAQNCLKMTGVSLEGGQTDQRAQVIQVWSILKRVLQRQPHKVKRLNSKSHVLTLILQIYISLADQTNMPQLWKYTWQMHASEWNKENNVPETLGGEWLGQHVHNRKWAWNGFEDLDLLYLNNVNRSNHMQLWTNNKGIPGINLKCTIIYPASYKCAEYNEALVDRIF